MKKKTIATIIIAMILACAGLLKAQDNKWTFDVSLYGMAAGMTGDIGVGPANADVDVGFDEIWENLEFGAMGKVRVGYQRWALTTDVIFMGLGGSKNGVSADMDQWLVEPTVSYRVSRHVEALAGARYNNLSGEIRGPFGRNPTGTQDWWDPIVGANLNFPLGKSFSFNVRRDIGGFGVGSDLTWQAFPDLGWQFTKWGSLHAGYRWVYNDYETGTAQAGSATTSSHTGRKSGSQSNSETIQATLFQTNKQTRQTETLHETLISRHA
jgi:hypothetical protein